MFEVVMCPKTTQWGITYYKLKIYRYMSNLIDKICVLVWWKSSRICVALHSWITRVSVSPPWVWWDLWVPQWRRDPSRKGSEDKRKRFPREGESKWKDSQTTSANILTSVSSQTKKLHFCRTSTRASLTITRAIRIPRQFRGPIPNGR